MAAPRGLHALARLHGVQTAYHDNDGRRVVASPEALLGALRALRVPVEKGRGIPPLIDAAIRERWARVVEPVVVAWDRGDGRGATADVRLRIPVRLRDEPVRVEVGFEDGGGTAATVRPQSLEVRDEALVDGVEHVALSVPLAGLPVGYHDLRVEVGQDGATGRGDALLVAAPRRARGWDVLERAPAWGVFAPLYALHRPDGSPDGAGGSSLSSPPTFADLASLAEWVADRGGSVVGTLPLLAAFLGDSLCEPSPYAPVSRLFWNELYVDPARAAAEAGLDPVPPSGADAAADWVSDSAGGSPLARGRFVDPRAGMRLRRPRLERLADRFFREGEPTELASFRARNPRADDYAAFRALAERNGAWRTWPARLRDRDVRDGDYDPAAARYHLFAQWLAERQLAEAEERAASRGVALYLDLPLGVHPSGYDVWRERALFAVDASAGAPPDPLAATGQDWGFPPMHPRASREDRHRYFIASIRKHLRFARVLRVDHVMQLHRMYWVPGGDARDGVYVRYPAEELYAVLSLESHRAGAVVVGEDLGTVPRAVRRGMRRHGLPGMYVAQFELTDTHVPDGDGARGGDPGGAAGEETVADDEAVDAALAPKPVPDGALASIGTHDTPTFAGWWFGRDLEIRRDLGQLPDEEAEAELRGRAIMRRKLVRGVAPAARAATAESAALDVQEALLRWMGRSRAGLVLATLEDLWLETEPQNVPGTTGDWNWRRRVERPLSALDDAPVARLLDALNEARERDE